MPRRVRKAMPNDLETLHDRTQARFGDLSEAERQLAVAAACGQVARCELAPAVNGEVTSARLDRRWIIRADLLRWLCVEAEVAHLIDVKGVHIEGARIAGALDFAYATLRFPLSLVRCSIPEGIDLTNARIRRLNLEGSTCGPLMAGGLHVENSLLLTDGFRALGGVRLYGCQIGLDLRCSGGRFLNRKAVALALDRARIRGSVYLDAGLRAYGEISLVRALIEADLECSAATIFNRGGIAIDCEAARIEGRARFGLGFRTNGTVNLQSTSVANGLSFNNARFFGPGRNGLDARNASIGGVLEWTEIELNGSTVLDLCHATAGQMADDERSWPHPGNLKIDGFVYSAFASNNGSGVTRLRWLARQKDFIPQTYQQLVQVLRSRGQEHEARDVAVVKEKHHLRVQRVGAVARVLRWLFGTVTGWGYKSWRVLYVPLVFVVAGWILFWYGYDKGVMFPAYEHAYQQFKTDGTIPESYPAFDPLVYTLDTFLPLTDFHQEEYWRPEAGRSCVVGGHHLPCGDILSRFLGIHILAGWVFAITGVAGILAHKD